MKPWIHLLSCVNIIILMVFKTIYEVNEKVIVHGKAEIYFKNTLIVEVAMK
jgi:hypothetical protein